MAAQLREQAREFQFHYCARSKNLMGFADQLLAAFPDRIKLHLDDQIALNLTELMAGISARTQLYICGPKGMIDVAKKAATDAGLDENNIHVELFSSPQNTSDDEAFEVEIHETGQVFTIPVGKTIINVLEEAGIDVMFDCQRGDCGICQTDVISGTPEHRDVVLSEADRDSGKVMQICVSRSKSSRLVLDL
jgi:ferredoxin